MLEFHDSNIIREKTMSKFLLAYHGGTSPETPEEGAKAMAAWTAWFEAIGPNVVDGGNPVGKSITLDGNGVTPDGGSNPVSGYSIIQAGDMAGAIEIANGCPIITTHGGTIEIAEIVDIG
ncbi:MAG: hypothetical protein ACI9PY_003021 [Ascidiaceihabitans sp.]